METQSTVPRVERSGKVACCRRHEEACWGAPWDVECARISFSELCLAVPFAFEADAHDGHRDWKGGGWRGTTASVRGVAGFAVALAALEDLNVKGSVACPETVCESRDTWLCIFANSDAQSSLGALPNAGNGCADLLRD